jgi:hypothetical protein
MALDLATMLSELGRREKAVLHDAGNDSFYFGNWLPGPDSNQRPTG